MSTLLSDEQAPRRTPGSNTLLRGLEVLECVARHARSGISVTDVAAATGLDKSTASRTLAALRDAGYLRQDARRRYGLTSKLAQLAEAHAGTDELRRLAQVHLDRLHRRFDEELHLAVLDAGQMVFIDYRPSSKSDRSKLPTVPAPAHLTAVGRAVLAVLPHEERSDVMHAALRASGRMLTRAETNELSDQLAHAQRQGWAGYDAGDGVTRVAAAVIDASGAPIGALCISGPGERLADRTGELARHVLATVEAIGRAAGA